MPTRRSAWLGNRVPCPCCKAYLSATGLKNHLLLFHKENLEDGQPIGDLVLKGLAAGKLYHASEAESCGVCRKRVAYFDMGNRLKAFEITSEGKVFAVHICGTPAGESSSVHAFQGGAIDSNRRRH